MTIFVNTSFIEINTTFCISVRMETKNIAKALSLFQGLVTAPKKNRTAMPGTPREYSYADLASILECIKQPMASTGLSITQLVQENEKGLMLETKLMHESGESLSSSLLLPLPKGPNEMQSLGTILTYARRYCLSSILSIAADDDTDAANVESEKPKPIKQEQPVEPKQQPKPKTKSMSDQILEASKANGWVKEDLQNYQRTRWATDKFATLQPKEQEMFLDTVQKFTFNQAMDAVRMLTATPFELGDDKL